MLASLLRSEAEVASCLSRHIVAERFQNFREVYAGNVARESHAAMTSSRTK